MINKVFIVGQVTSATERDDGKVLDLLVEYKRYYGYGDSANFAVNTHNVYLVSNTAQTKKFIDNSSAAKKPTYVGISGMIAERSLEPLPGSDSKYGPSQVYILGTKVLQLSNEAESSECQAFFQGKVVWKETRQTQNGKPMTKMIVRHERQRKNKDGEEYTANTGVPITVFREGNEVPFDVGDTAMFNGTMDSYELRDYPGVYTSSITSFDYLGASTYVTEEAAAGAGMAVAAPEMGMGNSVVIRDDEFPPEDDLPF